MQKEVPLMRCAVRFERGVAWSQKLDELLATIERLVAHHANNLADPDDSITSHSLGLQFAFATS